MHDGAYYDLLIAGIAAASLIFMIMLLITRSLVAAAVIVGTVLLSLGASFGMSVLLWQHILGLELHWMVLPMAVILLLAVGSDYNLLLVSRFKEELHGGSRPGSSARWRAPVRWSPRRAWCSLRPWRRSHSAI